MHILSPSRSLTKDLNDAASWGTAKQISKDILEADISYYHYPIALRTAWAF